MRLFLLSLIPALALSGCGLPDNVVVLVPDEEGHVGRAVVEHRGASAELSGARAAVGTSANRPPGEVFTAKPAQIERTFAAALAATPRPPKVFYITFINGTADLAQDGKSALTSAIAACLSTPFIDISISGNADATGSESLNRTLSNDRAERVRAALVAAKIPPDIIDLAYYGSTNPRIPSPPGIPVPENRRVDITIR